MGAQLIMSRDIRYCLLVFSGTTIICVWTSLHWDIQLERVGSQPPLKCFNTTLPRWLSNIRRLIGQYTLFVGVAIFCPELLLYYATSQLFCAWKLRNCFSNVLKEISDKNRAAGYTESRCWSARQFLLQYAVHVVLT